MKVHPPGRRSCFVGIPNAEILAEVNGLAANSATFNRHARQHLDAQVIGRLWARVGHCLKE
jgi:hypothetical protein